MPTREELSRAIAGGLDACDLLKIANEDVITHKHLRLFLEGALQSMFVRKARDAAEGM